MVWARLALALLDLLGVDAVTSRLGAVAPRAIVLGTLALCLVLIVLAPIFFHLRAAGDAPGGKADGGVAIRVR